jgi:23S rRNA-/tRNA-specific pseudouridylate synthase
MHLTWCVAFAPLQAIPEDIPLDVVFEDAHVIVVNKVRGGTWSRGTLGQGTFT